MAKSGPNLRKTPHWCTDCLGRNGESTHSGLRVARCMQTHQTLDGAFLLGRTAPIFGIFSFRGDSTDYVFDAVVTRRMWRGVDRLWSGFVNFSPKMKSRIYVAVFRQTLLFRSLIAMI